MEEIGAHAEGKNSDSVGICLAGLNTFSANQFATLTGLMQALRQIWPAATVHAHREFNPGKTCPVFDITPFKVIYELKEQP